MSTLFQARGVSRKKTGYFAQIARRSGVPFALPTLYLLAGTSGERAREAATQLAAETGRNLQAVDLSRVRSKFIGETEKNLARIFAAAAAGGSLLFFDEADALFGRRSDVRDAHDRYASAEADHLLQQLDRWSGIALLAFRNPAAPRITLARRRILPVRWPPP